MTRGGRSGRLSLGGNALASSRLNIRSPSGNRGTSGNKRRVSFGGMGTLSNLSNDLQFDNTTNGHGNGHGTINSSLMEPKKDRRAMLAEWRAQNKAKEANKSLVSGSGSGYQQQHQHGDLDKENFTNRPTPSIPSLPVPPSSAEGTTAVERFRMRRLQRERRALGEDKYHPTPPIPPSDKLVLSSSSSVASTSTGTTATTMTSASAL